MKTILRNQPNTLEHTVYVGDEPTAPDDGLTVDVQSLDGFTVAEGDAAEATADPETFQYRLSMPAVDILRVTWSGTVGGEVYEAEQFVEVAGAVYAPVPAIRGIRSLQSEARFSDEDIQRERRAAEAVFEKATGVAYVPRATIYTFDSHGGSEFDAPVLKANRVVRATVDGADVPTDEWMTYPDGLIVSDEYLPSGRRNVTVLVEHGYRTPPPEIMGAFFIYVRYRLLEDDNGLPDRATSLTVDGGTFEVATAGPDRPTGLPEVDAVLLRASEKTPTIL